MGRKKKKETQQEVVQVVQNTLPTKGNVKITLYRKDKKVRTINTHNTGTIYLCEYLRDACIGENVLARRPGKIKICKKDSSGELEPYYSYPIKYTESWKNSFQSTDTACSASISFFIPSSILTSNMTIQGFKLYSLDTNEEEYAVVDLTSIEDPTTHVVTDQSFEVTGDTNLEVEWTLQVSYD